MFGLVCIVQSKLSLSGSSMVTVSSGSVIGTPFSPSSGFGL